MTSTTFAPGNSTIVRSRNSVPALVRTYFGLASRLLPGVARRHAERLFTRPPRYAGRSAHPVPARRETVVADNRPLAVWQAGAPAAPAVLLAHGWGGRGVQMGRFVPALLERGFRVVWFDQPGHGESGDGASGLPDMVAAVQALAATHGPFAAAVGHSLGAAALALALRRGLALERVVFVSPPSSIQEQTRHFARLLGITAAVREAMRGGLERRYGLPFAEIDRLEDLAAVAVPALFVHDTGDREVPFHHALRLSAAMARARLLQTHGLGHQRILRDPAVVAAVADFIAGREEGLPAELPQLPDPAPLY